MKLRAFLYSVGASFFCEILAIAFFFWSDWRVGVGYVLVWLSDLSSREAFDHARATKDFLEKSLKARLEDDNERS